MSSFSWLDYSETDRRRMLDVIQVFREKGTLDELGIGTVRDAIADRLFPGTSTIQTRAKYFLFVPWIYKRLEKRKVPSGRIAESARNDEVRLMEALKKSHPENKFETGVIGRDAGAGLKRLPSNIYWNGLGAWGLRQFVGSQMEYHKSLDQFYVKNKQRHQTYGEDEEYASSLYNWHPNLPEPPADFPEKATLFLSKDEGQYLLERIVTKLPDTLLEAFVRFDNFDLSISFLWEHPNLGELRPERREEVEHARNFSEVIHGAQLLYNNMLAENRSIKSNDDNGVSKYRTELIDWAQDIEGRQVQLARWDWQGRFWEMVLEINPRIASGARAFIQRWLEIVLVEGAALTITENAEARNLISDREAHLKRGQARLKNPRALELWSGESFAGQLNYRWNVVQTLLRDISMGLSEPQ